MAARATGSRSTRRSTAATCCVLPPRPDATSATIGACSASRASEYRRDGAFAEYVAVPQHILYRLPERHPARARGDGRAAVDRRPCRGPHAGRARRHGGRRRRRHDRPLPGPGAAGGRLRARSSPSTSSRRSCALAARLGARAALDPRAVDASPGGGGGHRTAAARTSRSRRSGSRPTLKTAIDCVRKGGDGDPRRQPRRPRSRSPLQSVVTRQLPLYGSCASPASTRPPGHDRPRRVDVEPADQRRRAARRGRGVVRAALPPGARA